MVSTWRACTSRENQAREDICRVGQSLFARGYVHATAGNISVQLDAQGQQISGDKASKTIALHRHIYEASAGTGVPARCVIHTHSTHCVVLTLGNGQADEQERELLPSLTPYFVMKVGHVPIRAVMLERLGPNVWHDTPGAAMATLEELEETAKLWLLSQRQPAALPADNTEELRQSFGAHW